MMNNFRYLLNGQNFHQIESINIFLLVESIQLGIQYFNIIIKEI